MAMTTSSSISVKAPCENPAPPVVPRPSDVPGSCAQDSNNRGQGPREPSQNKGKLASCPRKRHLVTHEPVAKGQFCLNGGAQANPYYYDAQAAQIVIRGFLLVSVKVY
jgi:hypothetical protein